MSDAMVEITIALIGFAGVILAALIGTRRKQRASEDEWKRKADELDARLVAEHVATTTLLQAQLENRDRRIAELESQVEQRDRNRDRERDRDRDRDRDRSRDIGRDAPRDTARDAGRDGARDVPRDRQHDRDERRRGGGDPDDAR